MTNADRIAALLEAHAHEATAIRDGVSIVWCSCGWEAAGPRRATFAQHVASVLAQAGVLETAGLSDDEVIEWTGWERADHARAVLRRLASGEPA